MRSIVVSFLVMLCAGACIAQTCVPAPTGIVSWYRAEGDARDSIGGNNGGINGGVAFGPGRVHQGFRFHGIPPEGINLANVPAFDFNWNGSFSIEAWVNLAVPTAQSGNDGFVIVSLNYVCSQAAQATQNLIIQSPSRKAFFHVRNATGAQAYAYTNNPVPLNTWIHLVAVRDTSCQRIFLYLNGVLENSVPDPTVTANVAFSTGANDWIGRRNACATQNTFNGGIDEVTIYNRALTPCEIAALHNASCAGKCPLGGCGAGGCGC